MRLLNRDVVCQRAVELVTDYLEDRLSRRQRRRFEAHLGRCPHCTEYLAQMRATIRLTGQVTGQDLPVQMRDDLVELYRRWQAEERLAASRRGSRRSG